MSHSVDGFGDYEVNMSDLKQSISELATYLRTALQPAPNVKQRRDRKWRPLDREIQ